MNRVAVIYPCFNRLDYTKITLPMVIQEISNNQNIIDSLFIFDDMSSDGTNEYINEMINKNPSLPIKYIRQKIGNSTFQTNYTYKNVDDRCEILIKIDNDIIVPKGYIETLVWLMDKHKDIGFLMMPEVREFPFIKPKEELKIIDRTHIGGVGAFRKFIFDKLGDIKTEGQFFGFTEYQNMAKKKLNVRACMLEGSGNTNLDGSSAYSRVFEYANKGWGRNVFWQGVKSISDKRN